MQAVAVSILSGMVIAIAGQTAAVVQYDEEWIDGHQIAEIDVGTVAVVAGEGIKSHV